MDLGFIKLYFNSSLKKLDLLRGHLCVNVKGTNRQRIYLGLRVNSYGGHFVFCLDEFLGKCVVGDLEICEFKT